MNLVVTSSPHVKNKQNTKSIMKHVILALLPATIAAVFFFGIPALAVIISSVVSAIIVEAIINIIKKEKLTIFDGSAALTGLLLALVLPPVMPIWMVIIGNIVAIGITKHAFGGLGHNIFNPALVGRLFLAVSYPITLTTWYAPGNMFAFNPVTAATPLALPASEQIFNINMLFGNIGGSIGETSGIALLLGAAWLFYKKIIDWKIPVSFFLVILLFSLIARVDPLFHLFTGGILIGGFFMLTDYVSSPITKIGRLLFGIFTGITVMAVRLYSHMPEGVAFSIVLMNAFVPLFDRIGGIAHAFIWNKIFPDLNKN